MEDDDFGEDISNAFSWRTHISDKIKMTRKYYEELAFPEGHKQMLEFFDTYFVELWDEESRNSEEGIPTKLKNSSIPRIISEESFFAFLEEDTKFTAMKELQLLELLCAYFDGDKLDPVRYLVFDCLFGDIVDEENVLRDAKAKFLGKLISVAVGTKCALVLECCAIFLQKFGIKGRCVSIVACVISDYCFLVPASFQILEEMIQVCPSFAHEFTKILPIMYSFHKKQKPGDDGGNDEEYYHYQNVYQGLPPIALMSVTGSWLANHPHCFTMKKTHDFIPLPSIHAFQDNIKLPRQNICPILGLLHWSVLSPLFKGVKLSSIGKSHFFTSKDGETIVDADKMQKASSLLHYGILNFFSIHCKTDPSSGEDDDLEPGEVSEVAKPMELIFEADIRDIITHLDETVIKLEGDITEENLGESIDRLAQILQVSKWSGCFLPTGSKKFKHVLKKVPKTKLFSKIMKSL